MGRTVERRVDDEAVQLGEHRVGHRVRLRGLPRLAGLGLRAGEDLQLASYTLHITI